MEYALPELLTREQILRILNERKLKMPDIESLSYNDLLRIYKTFAVPLARREPHGNSSHHVKRDAAALSQNIIKCPNGEKDSETAQKTKILSNQQLHIHVHTCSIPQSFTSSGKKRPFPDENSINRAEHSHDATIAKRNKVTWP